MKSTDNHSADAPPPILGSWNRLYIFVLVLHTLLILSMYFFSQSYQ